MEEWNLVYNWLLFYVIGHEKNWSSTLIELTLRSYVLLNLCLFIYFYYISTSRKYNCLTAFGIRFSIYILRYFDLMKFVSVDVCLFFDLPVFISAEGTKMQLLDERINLIYGNITYNFKTLVWNFVYLFCVYIKI